MLADYVTLNRERLIAHCAVKEATRLGPTKPVVVQNHGIPLFLEQLVDALRHEHSTDGHPIVKPDHVPSPAVIGRAAAVHGIEMLRLGFTIDQVVHEYGDVCQSITELAATDQALFTTDEFRTLNRCLDDAIADAVKSFGIRQCSTADDAEQTMVARLETFSEEHRRLMNIAVQAFSAMKNGHVGLSGATSALLTHTMGELLRLPARMLPGDGR